MTPTLLLTRPKGQNGPVVEQIRARWDGPLSCIKSPLLAITFETVPKPDVDAVVLTSVNGVQAATRLGLADGRVAWCVGNKTAQIASAAGFAAKAGPGDADGLVSHILSAQPIGSLAHVRGAHARGDIAARLTAAGLNCVDVTAYAQTPKDLSAQAMSAVQGENPVVLPLFSPRTATILASQGPFKAPLHAGAMSVAVRDALGNLGLAGIRVARRPDASAMVDAIVEILEMLRRS